MTLVGRFIGGLWFSPRPHKKFLNQEYTSPNQMYFVCLWQIKKEVNFSVGDGANLTKLQPYLSLMSKSSRFYTAGALWNAKALTKNCFSVSRETLYRHFQCLNYGRHPWPLFKGSLHCLNAPFPRLLMGFTAASLQHKVDNEPLMTFRKFTSINHIHVVINHIHVYSWEYWNNVSSGNLDIIWSHVFADATASAKTCDSFNKNDKGINLIY